jgi:hypothetical protein
MMTQAFATDQVVHLFVKIIVQETMNAQISPMYAGDLQMTLAAVLGAFTLGLVVLAVSAATNLFRGAQLSRTELTSMLTSMMSLTSIMFAA